MKYPRAECLAFIEAHESHPAVAAALEYMDDLIRPSEKAGFLRREFARLRAAGATPKTMLASAMGLFFWAECNGHWEPGLRPFNDRCFDLNLGRALLGTVPAQTRITSSGKTSYVRVRPSHAEALGQNLRVSVGLLCLTSARKILKDSGWYAPDERGRLILEAMKSAPFDRNDEE
ncbi:hypothetical protein [Agrilutibacter solisilvae]|uniref:Uncharacterized protein n=1 Tax=Agrilutibacter solisilvae TaxID=2763317 RepID=A0A975ASM7_9GAMM|nr:hypothetical protein [Lysobacter solisilvae]QSX78115.1 hypothetical protein I8J32_015670 [Lysobacter solisilvae]